MNKERLNEIATYLLLHPVLRKTNHHYIGDSLQCGGLIFKCIVQLVILS
jgi:hypothetical protein